jgi:hypothetical protein
MSETSILISCTGKITRAELVRMVVGWFFGSWPECPTRQAEQEASAQQRV